MDSCRNTTNQLKKAPFILLLVSTMYSSTTLATEKAIHGMIYGHWCLMWHYYHTLPHKHSKQSNVTAPNQLVWITIALTHLKSTEILSLLWISHQACLPLNDNARLEYPL